MQIIVRIWKRAFDPAIKWFRTVKLRLNGIEVGSGLAAHGQNRLSVGPKGRFVIGNNVLLGLNVMMRVGGEGSELILEDGVQIQDNTCILCNGKLRIGKDSILVNGTIIYCDGEINIGEAVLIAGYTHIFDVDHNMERLDVAIRYQGLTTPSPVRICDGAWLGAKVTVCRGVTIGKHAVIGANSVVTKDVADFAIAAGTPAKILRYRNANADKIVEMEAS